MKSFTYTIQDEIGIHARPAGALAKLTKEFTSAVVIKAGDKSAKAGSLMAVMAMGIKQGTEVTVEADGADEDAAIAKLEAFFKENL